MATVKHSNPFLWVKDNIAYSNNGDIIKCYKLDLVETYSASEADFDTLYSNWYKALKSLTPGIVVLKQDVCLKKVYDTSILPDSNFLQKATKEHFNNREYVSHESYLFFVYTKTGVLKDESIKNPFKRLPKAEEVAEQAKQIDEIFNREINQTVEFLNTTRLIKAVPLSANEIHAYTRSYFNGFYQDRVTDSKKHDRYYQIGDRFCGSYVIKSLKQLPESVSNAVVDPFMSSTDYQFFRGFADGLTLDLNFDHVYTQVLFIEDSNLIKNSIKAKQQVLFGARGFSSDNKAGAIHLEEYLDQEVAKDEKIKYIRAHFNVTFFAESEQDFKKCDNDLSKKFKTMDIMPYYPKGNNLSNIFNNTFFAYISNLNSENAFVIDLQQAICFLSNVTNYKSDEEGIYFNDRVHNIPVKKDTWDDKKKRLKARNFFVMAPTGEGKSFLCNHIFRQYYEQGIILVLNDLGDSYQKLSYLYPEDTLYIRYKEGQPLGVNPMYLANETLGITLINQIVKFIALLWKRDKDLDETQEISLRKLIECYYKQVPNKHSFPSFYEFVNLNKEHILETLEIDYQYFDIDEFLHNCSEFVDKGSYGFLFREGEEFAYDIANKKVVVFEYDEAKEDPLLLSILLLLSSDITRRLCWLDKSKKGVVFFDEFAKFLKFPAVLNLVQYYYQAARKQECAIGTVLQTPTQLPENDTAKSIIENTQVLYILKNTKGYDPIIDRFNLSSHAKNQLMSMSSNFSGQRKYSEFYLQLDKEGNVMRLEVPEKVFCAYLTEGKIHAEIMKYYEKDHNMENAINEYIKNKN